MSDEAPWWRTASGVPQSWERINGALEQVPSVMWAFFGLSMLLVAAASLIGPGSALGGAGGFVGMAFGNYYLRARRRERTGAG